MTRRSSARIAPALKEAKPKMSIKASMLDGDPLILNTPDGEINLETGEMQPHDPEHFITHMTSNAPSDKGAELSYTNTPGIYSRLHIDQNKSSCFR